MLGEFQLFLYYIFLSLISQADVQAERGVRVNVMLFSCIIQCCWIYVTLAMQCTITYASLHTNSLHHIDIAVLLHVKAFCNYT